MPACVDLISIGTLSRNRFWGDSGSVRRRHATSALLRDGELTLLTDPSLPPELLLQRLDERSGLKPEHIDVVFLTNFRPVHRRGLELFERATWMISAEERDAMESYLEELAGAAEARKEQVDPLIESELRLLRKCESAPDHISESIHLFPTPGVTPGACSLLALQAERTIAVAGDAIISKEYFARSQAFEQHSNAELAVQAISELAEIADIIVPGHDDWILNF